MAQCELICLQFDLLCCDNGKMRVFLCFAFVALFGASLMAQEQQAEPELPRHWEFRGDSGQAIIALSAMVSVSMHEYVIDGAAFVVECTIDTTGNQTLRFYYVEPLAENALTDAVKEGAKQVSAAAVEILGADGRATPVDLEKMVTKHYPQTTHAKTTEYRFKNRANVQRVYSHALNAIARGDSHRVIIHE